MQTVLYVWWELLKKHDQNSDEVCILRVDVEYAIELQDET